MDDLLEFEQYMAHLSAGLGHADRNAGLRGYCTGLMSPLSRKSVEPMAAHVDPMKVRSRHQSLHHFVADASWSDEQMLLRVSQWVVPLMDFSDGGWWIIDDTGFPKQGRHSVAVARQYCGMLGKQDNCQVAVSVSLANDAVSVPVAYRLYVPERWAQDRRRRRAVGVPDDLEFQPKWQLALAQIRALLAEGVPPAPVVADAGYGDTTEFREAVTAAGLAYAVGVKGETTVWRPGQAPRPPTPRRGGRGRPSIRVRRTARHQPVSLTRLAAELPASAWQTVTWREGTRGAMRSRFARLRVRPAHRDEHRSEPRPEEWLVMEWPRGESDPTKYWLSTLPAPAPIAALVRLAKLRWRIERDYQELKDELGLDHFQGRGWRGFHHHGALCIAAYAFLAAERATLSPPVPLAFLRPARLPKGFTPRGAPGAA
jgi:SRSO17 transposase